jgi:membrane fusion protein, multidrug efflux system
MSATSTPGSMPRSRIPLRGRPLVLGLAALLALLSAACRRESPPAAAGGAPAPIEVRTARVGGAGEGWVEVPGAVEAVHAAELASRLSAVVESVHAEEGAFVHAGDLLVRLGGSDVRARLEAGGAAFKAAHSQLDRMRTLFQKNAATQQEVDAAEAADAAAQAERDAARAQIAYVDIRAPFDGWITAKRVQTGDLALPGQTLVSIQGVGRLRVAATVTEGQAERLHVGQAADAVLEDGKVVPTRIAILGRTGDTGSRRFLVKSDLPKDAGARAGSFARLRLPRGPEDEETPALVPAGAVIERGALTGVFVVEDGVARLRWISLGEPAGDAVLVRAGLRAGEEVVLAPGGLDDGTPVRASAVVERAPAGATGTEDHP